MNHQVTVSIYITVAMFVDATILILFSLHGAYSHGEGMCSSFEMRRTVIDKELTAVGCENYSCGKIMIRSMMQNS